MESFIVDCPNCRKKLRVREEWKGRSIRCHHCKKQVVVGKNAGAGKSGAEDAASASKLTARDIVFLMIALILFPYLAGVFFYMLTTDRGTGSDNAGDSGGYYNGRSPVDEMEREVGRNIRLFDAQMALEGAKLDAERARSEADKFLMRR